MKEAQTAEALVMQGVTHGYRAGVPVLNGLSLTHATGVAAVLGPNGAGKSTLLRLAAGLATPQSGRVQVAGLDTRRAREAALARTAFLPENLYLDGYLTPCEFLRFVADIRGIADGEARGVELLEALGGGAFGDRLFRELSFGMQRKVGIAAALLGQKQTSLLVLDEPDTGLDVTAMHSLERMIAGVAADGRAVLLSSHDMGFVARCCATVFILGGGQVVWSGPPAALVDAHHAPDLHHAMLSVLIQSGGAVV
ncbi:MAG: ABC transporter ATP-binding protein [Nitrospirota bacterium]|nr:ABC transporter ATP-binding protein [Nitrospirota bacterium]